MTKSSTPVRIAFLTSIRDIGVDDKVGRIVPTDNGPDYMEGIAERTIKETLPGGKLHGFVQVAVIITDDRPKDVEPFGYCAIPNVLPCLGIKEEQWIFPPSMPCDTLGTPARLLVQNMPSEFRSIPMGDPLRAEAKRAYEQRVLDLMHANGAKVLISDHYMAKIEYLIGKELGLYGKVLNIHPAVTSLDSPFCCRGATPTADVLARAKKVATMKTGATLHLVNDKFDDGPIVEWAAPTPVHARDLPAQLRYRNYQMAKLPVFIRGIKKYVTQVLPQM